MVNRLIRTAQCAVAAAGLLFVVAASAASQSAGPVSPRRTPLAANDTSRVAQLEKTLKALSATLDSLKREAPIAQQAGVERSRTGGSAGSSRKQKFERLRELFVSTNPDGCSLDGEWGARFCGLILDTTTDSKAGATFWEGKDRKSYSTFSEVQMQGLGNSKSQSTYVELINDYWGLWRVGLAGVFKSADSSTDQSKAQQFLNGGGPAQLTLLRPIALFNSGLVQTTLFGHAQASFTVPGQDTVPRDSLKYADFGAEVQSRIEGADSKIGGLFFVRQGYIIGGNALYTALGESSAFATVTMGVGITVEKKVAVIWNKVLMGPSTLRNADNLITVKFTR
ncbi:MAG TPA: hypothetical protein VN651_10560 [Gemmatimonadaceae bacterium]|nr:hypothetical protein [Gemmatimonadaceae bacterium]